MVEEKKKYNYMENVLQDINGKFISLSEIDKKRNNGILKSILELITTQMKEEDALFAEIYSTVFFGGSFYDGLKVGQPDEFDIDLLLRLPKLAGSTVTTSDKSGFVHVQLKEYPKLLEQKDLSARYKNLNKLMDEDYYLDTFKVLIWMESLISRTLNNFVEEDGADIIIVPIDNCGSVTYEQFYVKVHKSGPAFTIKVSGSVEVPYMHIDFVPCFVFGDEKWPNMGFRPNPIKDRTDYFVVPKPLKYVPNSSRYWRPSFQQQERVIIDSKRNLKPTLRLLKKLRDTMDHKCIVSYYIKTVLLWQAFIYRDEEFWRNSLSYVFMNILNDYSRHLNDGEILYFWNENNNLIEDVKKETIDNISNRIKAVICDIERHPDDPFVVAKYLLTPSEFEEFKRGAASNNELSVQLSGLNI